MIGDPAQRLGLLERSSYDVRHHLEVPGRTRVAKIRQRHDAPERVLRLRALIELGQDAKDLPERMGEELRVALVFPLLQVT